MGYYGFFMVLLCLCTFYQTDNHRFLATVNGTVCAMLGRRTLGSPRGTAPRVGLTGLPRSSPWDGG